MNTNSCLLSTFSSLSSMSRERRKRISVILIVSLIIKFTKVFWQTFQTSEKDLTKTYNVSSNFIKRSERVNTECSKLAKKDILRPSYIEPENFVTLER